MSTKITKKDNFEALKTLALENEMNDLVAFIDNEIALLDKRNASSSKAKAEKQAGNLDLAKEVFDTVLSDKGQTVTELFKAFDDDRVGSTSKMTTLLTLLVENGLVKRVVDKRTPYYSKIGD